VDGFAVLWMQSLLEFLSQLLAFYRWVAVALTTLLALTYFGPLIYLSWAPRCNLRQRYFADFGTETAPNGREAEATAENATRTLRETRMKKKNVTQPYHAASKATKRATSSARSESAGSATSEPWALVTGASSGIGLSIVRQVAQQGINVVLVARDDALLPKAIAQLRVEFPERSFRIVATDLSEPSLPGGEPGNENNALPNYLSKVAEETKDLFAAGTLRLVFSNAGYLLMSFYWRRSLSEQMRNWECNITAALRLTHFVLEQWSTRQHSSRTRDDAPSRSSNVAGGLLAFTSSSSFFLPTPFATLYGAEKAALTSFAQSLAVEVRDLGVDVLVVHPSYTRTNLYSNQPKLAILQFLDRFTGATPDYVATTMLRAIGRGFVVRDIGLYSYLTRWLGHMVDIGFMSSLIVHLRHLVPEYRQFSATVKTPASHA
jgi:short-subunit dehydrogenase